MTKDIFRPSAQASSSLQNAEISTMAILNSEITYLIIYTKDKKASYNGREIFDIQQRKD